MAKRTKNKPGQFTTEVKKTKNQSFAHGCVVGMKSGIKKVGLESFVYGAFSLAMILFLVWVLSNL